MPTVGIPSSYTQPPALVAAENCDWLADPLRVSATPTASVYVGHTGNNPSQVSDGSVRYQDGVLRYSTTDLASEGFGAPWAQVRSWSNAEIYDNGYNNGAGWVDSQLLSLFQINKSNTIVALISSATTARYFDDPSSTGTYAERFFGANVLKYNSGADQYTLTTPEGMRFKFAGFSSSNAGLLLERTDAYGNVDTLTYTSGKLTSVARGSTTTGQPSELWTYTYLTSGANSGQMDSVTYARGPYGGTMTTVRKVEYDYYTSSSNNGSNGDLKAATIKDASSNVLDVNYYRYYKSGAANGYTHGLKMAFGAASYDRLSQACTDASTTPDAASDSFVDDYADLYIEYDGSRRVSLERVQGAGCSACSGGIGEYTFSYSSSGNSAGFNSWSIRTTETLPDGNQNVVYTNAYGQVMLRKFVESSQNWFWFYEYDGAGRTSLSAAPSAVTSFSESYADLLHKVSGLYDGLANSAGLVTRYRYASSTTATSTTAGDVAGYFKGIDLLRGESGTAQPQFDAKYFETTQNGITLRPRGEIKSYASVDGSGVGQDARVTSYAYTFFGTAAIETATVTYPLISTTQNGPGGSAYDVEKSWADRYGRLLWSKDADGYVNYWEFGSPAVRTPTKMIVDADTSITGDFSVSVPSGLSSPSGTRLRLTSTNLVDDFGRATKMTSPEGRITYNVYLDANHEVRSYPGWNAGSLTTTGPTIVQRDDRLRSYTETLTMSATPHTTSSVPDGTESIASVQTLSRSFVNAAGQRVQSDAYFNLSGVSYSTSTSLGTINTNFYRTLFRFDTRGRPNRTELATGTIYRTVFDGLGRPVSTWVGTDDTPSSGYWSPTNLTGTNTVKTSEMIYDGGGVGDGNLTKMTAFPGGGAADRVTDYSYDWRNRRVATKQGVESSESTSVNRPIFYTEYNNLGETVYSERYDGDTASITTDSNSDGVPDRPSSSLLRAKTGVNIDDRGRVYRSLVYSVSSSGTVGDSLNSQWWYDHRGNTLKTSVPGGIVTKYTYDGAGRTTIAYTSDGGGDYDAWSDADDVSGDRVLQQIETAFDKDGLAISTITRQHFHDDANTGALGNAATNPKARVSYTATYYDNAMRTTATADYGTYAAASWSRPSTVDSRSDTVLVTSWTYNAAGWVEFVTDPKDLDTKSAYDNLGRVVETIENYDDGTPSDANDKTTQFTYDGSNHLLTYKLLLPASAYQTTQYLYGYSTSVISSNDLLAEVRRPNKGTGAASSTEDDHYTFNALGEILTAEDRNGTIHTFSRDVLGRLTSDAVTTLGSGVANDVRRLETGYDGQGNPHLFSSYNSSSGGSVVNQVQREFNGWGQLTKEYQEHAGSVNTSTSKAVTYGFTAESSSSGMWSRLTSMTYPNASVLNYNYGSSASELNYRISRLKKMTDGSIDILTPQYLGFSTLVERANPQTTMTYIGSGTGEAGDKYVGLDRFGRIVDLVWKATSGGTERDHFQYGYDRDSNRLWRDNLVSTTFGELYTYDGLNQLATFDRGTLNGTHTAITGTATRTQTWAPDAPGNFISVVTDGSSQSRSHNRQNQITALGSATPTYDNNGNLTGDGGTWTHTFDAWNRLATSDDGQFYYTHVYDALGRRIMETKDNTGSFVSSYSERHFYYNNAWQVIEERKVTQTSTFTEVMLAWDPTGSDRLIYRDRDSAGDGTFEQRLYVQQDAQGNVTALIDTSGAAVERYVQDPYVVVTILTGSWGSRGTTSYEWKYYHQGLRLDMTGTMYDNRARFFSPTLMRFMQEDPIGFAAGDQNLYRYVGNNAVTQLDPMGLKFIVRPKPENFLQLRLLGWVECRNQQPVPVVSDLAKRTYPGHCGKLILRCIEWHEDAHIRQFPKDICKGRDDGDIVGWDPNDIPGMAPYEIEAHRAELECLRRSLEQHPECEEAIERERKFVRARIRWWKGVQSGAIVLPEDLGPRNLLPPIAWPAPVVPPPIPSPAPPSIVPWTPPPYVPPRPNPFDPGGTPFPGGSHREWEIWRWLEEQNRSSPRGLPGPRGPRAPRPATPRIIA